MKIYRIPIVPMMAVKTTRKGAWDPKVKLYQKWKQDLVYLSHQVGLNISQCSIMEICFGIPSPQSWSKAKRARMQGLPHLSRPDLDNLIKPIMDAWGSEDSHVHTLTAKKVWAEEGFIEIGLPES